MKEVYKRSDTHKYQKFDIRMYIFDKTNKKRERYFESFKQITLLEKKSLIKFYKPVNIKNTSLLTISDINISNDKNQWIYLPVFRKIKKLNSEDQKKSFMGSDFTYDDISNRNLDEDDHSIITSDKKYFYIKSVPKNSDSSYSKIEMTIHKKLFIMMKSIFYDKNKNKIKILTNNKFKKLKNVYYSTDITMKNLKTGGYTELIVSDIKVGKNLFEDINIKSLRK